jgi:hypothetical protein
MFVDHVRCLHNQIHTVLKMCSTNKNYIQIKFTILLEFCFTVYIKYNVNTFVNTVIIIYRFPLNGQYYPVALAAILQY